MPVNMLQTEIVFNKESNCQTSGFKNFCIREYVAAIRERDPATCWPFGSIYEFKDLDTQEDVAPESLSLSNLKITEDTNAPELPEVHNSKGKEVEFEAPTAFEVEVSKNNEAGSKTVTAFELEWTKENNTGSEIATAKALLEISKGNKAQLETATAFELEIPKGKKTQSENASASADIEKRKCRFLSELPRDLAGPDIESTLHFADKVDENTDKSDEDFTIDDDEEEDDSDDDTLCMFLKKRKAVKITSRSNRSRNYKRKKTRATKPKPKPSNRGPKGSKARTKRAKPHPHDNFATRKLVDAVTAEVALAANRKRCGSYDRRGGTGRSVVGQPVVGVGGSKDPGPVVMGTPGKRGTLVCVLNRNPADFTIVGPGNKYMRRF